MKRGGKFSRRKLFELAGAGATTVVGASAGREALADRDDKTGGPSGKRAGDATLPQVPRRILGKTGASIPILLFGGSVRLDQRRPDPKLSEALRFGVNYIDAARVYGGGTCEVAVARFHTWGNLRDRLWLTSKSDRHDPAGFEDRLDTSLRELATTWVDMYYLHALEDADVLSRDMERMVAKLKRQGKMRFFGFSCHHGDVPEMLARAAQLPWIDSVMFRYNFRNYGDRDLNLAIDACARANIGLIAMKTQGSVVRETWQKFEQRGRWNKYQAVLKSVWADPRITAAVSRMDTFEKLRDNIAAAVNRTKLTRAEDEAIERYAVATRSAACHGCDHICGHAVAAPVQIGNTLRYLMYHDVYGEREEARALFRQLPAAAQRLGAIDFAPGEAACPHGVALVEHMKRAAKVFCA